MTSNYKAYEYPDIAGKFWSKQREAVKFMLAAFLVQVFEAVALLNWESEHPVDISKCSRTIGFYSGIMTHLASIEVVKDIAPFFDMFGVMPVAINREAENFGFEIGKRKAEQASYDIGATIHHIAVNMNGIAPILDYPDRVWALEARLAYHLMKRDRDGAKRQVKLFLDIIKAKGE